MKDIRVKLNDEVKAGAPIGAVGQRGPATGPHLHFEARSGKKTYAAGDVRDTIDPYKVVKRDKTQLYPDSDIRPPNVTSFSASASQIGQGQSVTLSYSVVDDMGLKQVELRRADDTAGVGFREIKRISVSGKQYSGSFSDTPPSLGTYHYGLHVVDTSGKWNCERNSQSGGSRGVYGPRQVAVIKVSTPAPDKRPIPPTIKIKVRSPLPSEYLKNRGLGFCEKNTKIPSPNIHNGIDIPAPAGTPVFKICDGKVVLDATDRKYWNSFLIMEHDCEGRKLYAYYGHIQKIEARDPNQIGVIKKDPSRRIPDHLHLSVSFTEDWNKGNWGYNSTCNEAKQMGYQDPWKVFDFFLQPPPQIVRPEIVSNLRILENPPYKVGQIITAEFSTRNSGNSPIAFDILTVGGRLNGQCPNNRCPDFEFRPNVTLLPNISYTYHGRLKIEAPGNYHFFTSYRTKDGQWNTSIPTSTGVRNTLDIYVASVPNVTPTPPTPATPSKRPVVDKNIPLGTLGKGNYSIHAFNVDDIATIKVNGRKIGSIGYYQKKEYPISPYLREGQNEIELTVENRGGGWTYGFELRKDGNVIWKDKDGEVGRYGALNNDQTRGSVYRMILSFLVSTPSIATLTAPQPSARIEMVDITPRSVQVGQGITLKMGFINTGNTTHTFIAGASLWRPDGDLNPDVDFEKVVTLAPGQTTKVFWTHRVDRPGNWGYQFAVWRQKPYIKENLLAKQPSPIKFFPVTGAGK